MKNSAKFWRLYDLFVASGFRDRDLAIELVNLIHADVLNLPECRPEKGWDKILGFVSLKKGKLIFGWVHHSQVLVLDSTKGEYFLVTHEREVVVHPRDMYGDMASLSMWLPLYTPEHIKAAVAAVPRGVPGPFYGAWLERNELVPV